jgi:ribonuclease HI
MAETFEAMLERLGIEEWDLVLVGDGSGSNWKRECGWGCVAFEANTLTRRVFYGAMNLGTVNVGEMMAYLQPLTWYLSRNQDEGKNKASRSRVIHIITDSEYVKTRGENGNVGSKRNHIMWSVLDLIKRQGYVMHWHHVPRDTVALNMYADLLSKAARLQIKGGRAHAATERQLAVEQCNQWE